MSNTTKQLLTESFYATTISENIPASGSCDFSVWQAPENKKWWIIISPSSWAKRERMFYHDVIGTRIYVKWSNRVNPTSHAIWDPVQINDISELFNYFSVIWSSTFYVEKWDGLSVTVWWWPVLIMDGVTKSVDDTAITLVNNTTNYIYFDTTTISTKNSTSESTIINDKWVCVCEITTAGWEISSILPRNYKLWAAIQWSTGITGWVWPTWPTWPTWDTGATGATGDTWATGATGAAWEIASAPTGEAQIISDNRVPDAGSVVTINTGQIFITRPDGSYTIFNTWMIAECWADWNFLTKQMITGSWWYVGANEWILYPSINWFVDKITWVFTFDWNPAYINIQNVFQQPVVFRSDAWFKGRVTFPYWAMSYSSPNIVFDALNWTKQRLWLDTWQTGTKTISFSNILSGSNYEFVLVINDPAGITLTKWTITDAPTWLVNFYSIWSTTYPLALSQWVHIFICETFDTAIHISYAGKSSEIV